MGMFDNVNENYQVNENFYTYSTNVIFSKVELSATWWSVDLLSLLKSPSKYSIKYLGLMFGLLKIFLKPIFNGL